MMSSSERNRQIKLIRLQYEQLSLKWGYDATDLSKRFQRRLEEAKLNKSDMSIFFQAENEAIKIFEERLKDYVEASELHDADHESEHDPAYLGIDEDSRNLYQAIEGKASSIGKYKSYQSIKIHEKASSEMEYLFGAMVDLRLVMLPALEEARKSIRDKAFHTMTYEIENLLNEVGDNQNGKLPSIFSVYKIKIEKASGLDQIGRARIEPFKAIVNIARKVRRLARWLENHKTKLSPHVRVMYGNEGCSIKTMGEYLTRDIQSIVKNFGLQSFSENY